MDRPASPVDPDWTLGAILASALAYDAEAERKALDEQAMYCASLELARQLAPHFDCPPAEVWDALTRVPDAMLAQLETPAGWIRLAHYIADQAGRPRPVYQPTIN